MTIFLILFAAFILLSRSIAPKVKKILVSIFVIAIIATGLINTFRSKHQKRLPQELADYQDELPQYQAGAAHF